MPARASAREEILVSLSKARGPLLILLFLLLLLPSAAGERKCPLNFIQDWNAMLSYYRPGDLYIGGIIFARALLFPLAEFTEPPTTQLLWAGQFQFWHILSFLFAIEEINQYPSLLPNLTLGYDVYDNNYEPRLTYEAMENLLSTGEASVPNYSCGRRKDLLAVIEGADSDTSKQISILSSIYKIPQVSYGFVSEDLNDKTHFPFIHRMVPKEEHHYQLMAKFLLHFGWNWVGLIFPQTDNGWRFMRTITPVLNRNEICVAITLYVTTLSRVEVPYKIFNRWKNVSVLIYYGEIRHFNLIIANFYESTPSSGKSGSPQ